MRLVTFTTDGDPGVGVRRDANTIVDAGYTDMHDLIRDGEAGLERARAAAAGGDPVEGARLLAPIRPAKMFCSGINYASHGEEAKAANLPVPEEPFFFSKLPSAIIGPGEAIRIPRETTQTDYEVELAFVIGKRAYRVSEESALDHVFGWTVLHDVSAREVQLKDAQITLGKNPDTFCPLGPEIVTSDELGDPMTLRVSTTLNGEVMQDASTGDFIFSPAQMLAFITDLITLEPGDLVSTGTPGGVGFSRDPQVFLKPGDTVTVSVDRIGDLTNPVVAGW
jgi:2-keto-4-pentenoate hydratase/2-oxohepta-3-ene-1,7-dioic acid hydratase in catechol pathway